MDNIEGDKYDNIVYPICFGFNILIVLVTTCLIIIYVKVKDLHSYPCYFNILLSVVISINNIARLINPGENSDNIGCKIQGFILALFDKLMLTTMTIYSIVTYLGIVNLEFYKENEKRIFIISTILSILISLIIAILFLLNGVVIYDDVCYVRSSIDETVRNLKVNKILIDIIVNSILLVINFYCILHLLIYVFRIMIESKKKNDQIRLKNYCFFFFKYLIIFILNNITFIMVILIIADKFFEEDELTSLFYIILSFFIVLFYTVNMRVLNEGKNIICCKKERTKSEEYKVEDEEGIEINYMNAEKMEGGE